MTDAPGVHLLVDGDVLVHASQGEITDVTDRATAATFYSDDLTPDQVAANRRIVAISAEACAEAAGAAHQRLAGAFVRGRLAGYVIATRHGADDLELDWLMVDPQHHGSGLAGVLMETGLDWLGRGRPIWLNVIRRNARAIAFYERFGFRVDADARTAHAVPHWIMRRGGFPV